MVMAYEAYVIHYASSCQPVTALCFSVEAFCGLAKARSREKKKKKERAKLTVSGSASAGLLLTTPF